MLLGSGGGAEGVGATGAGAATGRAAMLFGSGGGAEGIANAVTGAAATGAGAIAAPRRSPPASARSCVRQPSEHA